MRDDRQTRHFAVVDQARAVENQVFFASVQPDRALGAAAFLGGARVVDPDGVVLARTGARPGLAVAHADLDEIRASRAVIDHLSDRRPDAYGDPLASSGADVRDRRRIRSL